VIFTAAQWRAFLRALVNLDPYTFIDDVAEHFIGDNENNQQTAEEILLSTLDGLADDKLTGLGLRLVLAGHVAIPSEGEPDYLTEAESAFIPPPPKKEPKSKKAATPVRSVPKKGVAKKKAAA
jgi:ParB family chromosome partitioning protein